MFMNWRDLLTIAILAGLTACKTAQTVKVESSRGELILFSTDDPATVMAKPAESSGLADVKANLLAELKVNPDSPIPMISLAQVQLARGELDSAEATARQILRKNLKNDAAKLVLANVYYRRGMNEMSAIILDGLGGAKSKDSQILNLLGLLAIGKNDNSRALALFTDALHANSSDVAVRMNLGVLYLKYHQLQEAAVQFERVLAVLPQHEDAKLHMAAIYTSRGQFKEAKDLYKAALSANENNPVALYNYAVLQSEMKEYDDAIDTLKSYIGHADSKSVRTDKAFALISEIRGKMAVGGKEYSNEEIDQLALELEKKDKSTEIKKNAAPVPSHKAVNSDTAVTENSVGGNGETILSAKSGRKVSKKTQGKAVDQTPAIQKKPETDDIDDLEKELMK
jgi:Flp pilus assembly protein TadD